MNVLSSINNNLIYEFYSKLKKANGLKPLDQFKNNIFSTFQVDIEKLVEMKFVVCKQLNQPWDLFDKLPFWEMEQMVNLLKKWIEKEKEEREKEEGKTKNIFDRDKFMRDTQGFAKKYGLPSPGGSSSISNIPSWNKISNFKPPPGINAASLKNMDNLKI